MIVKELKNMLKKYPDTMKVVVSGYEDGWDDVDPDNLTVTEVILNSGGRHSYEGKHLDVPFTSEGKQKIKGQVEKVLCICRSSY